MRRVAIVWAHVVGVDCTDVVRDGAVVAARVPLARELRRHHELLCDLLGREAVAHQAQRLVVQIAVHIALARDIFGDALAPPHGPVMLDDKRVDAWDERVEGLVEIAGPRQ